MGRAATRQPPRGCRFACARTACPPRRRPPVRHAALPLAHPLMHGCGHPPALAQL